MWQWCSSVWTASWINETARARLFSAPWGTTTAELWSQGKLFGNAVDSKPLLSQFKWFKVKFWVCVVYSNLIWSKEVVTSTQIPIFLEGIWFHLSKWCVCTVSVSFPALGRQNSHLSSCGVSLHRCDSAGRQSCTSRCFLNFMLLKLCMAKFPAGSPAFC